MGDVPHDGAVAQSGAKARDRGRMNSTCHNFRSEEATWATSVARHGEGTADARTVAASRNSAAAVITTTIDGSAMFDFHTLSEADFTDYTWPEDDLAGLKAYLANRPTSESSSGESAGAGQCFDDIVLENLREGLYIAQLNSILAAIDDPRPSRAHLQVLGKIIEHTNNQTGMAYPGAARLAAAITHYNDAREPQYYRQQTISNLIADLKRWGYLVQDKRGVDGKGRAVSHYATTVASVAERQAQIAYWCMEKRGSYRRFLVTA